MIIVRSNRIEWVDIFKGLLIILVVIGHSSNVKLIPLIYAFHMAAFFFIHGYTSNYEKDNFITYFIKKFKSLFVSFFTFNIAVYLFQMVLNFLGVYHYFYSTAFDYSSILDFFRYFWTFDLAGATWFLIVLFFASILSRLLYDCLKLKNSETLAIRWHLVISTLLFLIFYMLFYSQKIAAAYFIDLIPLSLFFISIGYYLKNARVDDYENSLTLIKILCIVFYLVIVIFLHEETEWSKRIFPNVLFLVFESLGGIFLFEYLSKFIVRFKDKVRLIYNSLIYIGNNTLAILKYHFLGFRLVFLVGVLVGVLNINSLQYLTPPYTSFVFTLLTALVSVLFSLVFDKIIKAIVNMLKKLKNNFRITINIKKLLSNMVIIVTLFLFLNIFICSFFYPSNVYYSENNFISLVITFIIFTFFYILYKKFVFGRTNIGKKKEIIIASIIFIIILMIEIFVLNNLAVNPAWDFGVVFKNAESYVLTGSRNTLWYPSYFEYYPNNMMLFAMLVKVIRIGANLGISSLTSSWIMNVVFIDVAYLMLYLTLRKKFGNRVSIFGLVISLLFVAPFLYVSIFYSDTLSMFVGISFVYFYFLLDFKKGISVKNILIFTLFGFLLFYGKSIKITSIIPFIAIILSILFDKKKIKTLVNLFFTCAVFLMLFSAFKLLVTDNLKFAFDEGTYGAFPYTHWVMMGIEDIDRDNSLRNSYGGYNPYDYEFTLSFETGKEASKHNISEIKRRIKKMGLFGYYNYLCKKSVNAWTDGLFFVDVKLQSNNMHSDEKIYNEIFNNNSNKMFLVYFSQGVQYLFIICLIFGSVIKLFIKDKGIDIVRMSIVGICLFLLMWENRSRYLLNFIPLFIYIICEFFVYLGQVNEKRKMKNAKEF